MCGNSNLVMKGIELKGIKTCTFTNPALEVASHRVQTGSCPQLNDTVKAELEKEQTQCQSGHFGNAGYESGNGMSLPRKVYGMGLRVSGVAGTGNNGCWEETPNCIRNDQCCSGFCKKSNYNLLSTCQSKNNGCWEDTRNCIRNDQCCSGFCKKSNYNHLSTCQSKTMDAGKIPVIVP